MRRDHPDLGLDAELVEDRRRPLGDLDVGAAADDDPDLAHAALLRTCHRPTSHVPTSCRRAADGFGRADPEPIERLDDPAALGVLVDDAVERAGRAVDDLLLDPSVLVGERRVRPQRVAEPEVERDSRRRRAGRGSGSGTRGHRARTTRPASAASAATGPGPAAARTRARTSPSVTPGIAAASASVARSTIPLPGRPGTDVLPMCSTCRSGRRVTDRSRSTRSATSSDARIPRPRPRRAAARTARSAALADSLTRGSVDSGDAHRDRSADHRGGRRLTSTSDRPRRPGRRRPGYRRWSGGPRPGSLGARSPRHRRRRQRGGDGRVVAPRRPTRGQGRTAQRPVRRRGRRATAGGAPRRRRRPDDHVSRGVRCSAARSRSTRPPPRASPRCSRRAASRPPCSRSRTATASTCRARLDGARTRSASAGLATASRSAASGRSAGRSRDASTWARRLTRAGPTSGASTGVAVASSLARRCDSVAHAGGPPSALTPTYPRRDPATRKLPRWAAWLPRTARLAVGRVRVAEAASRVRSIELDAMDARAGMRRGAGAL